MSDYKAAIGKRVSALRKMNGLTQEDLAELLDCSVKHISHSERGLALLSLEKYLFLSDYFGCSLDYLLKGSAPSDVTSSLPTFMVEILSKDEGEERELLMTYLNMFSRIKNIRD
jgi:transcriptional regulator with XRE-family HTH domain